jgi:molybdopterin molybdotransferase
MPWARSDARVSPSGRPDALLPARLSADGAEVTPVAWHGSGDIPALTRANAFLVADPDRDVYAAGEWIRVLLQ